MGWLGRGVAVEELPDRGLLELLEQVFAAWCRCDRLVAVARAVDQGRADVGFEAIELQEKVLVMEAENLCCGVDAGMTRELLESAQPLPAVAFAFDRAPDVGG